MVKEIEGAYSRIFVCEGRGKTIILIFKKNSNNDIHIVDTVFCTLDLHVGPQKFQKYYLISIGPWRNLNWCGVTRSGIGALEMPFPIKLTKMLLVNLGLTENQTRLKSSRNNIFHAFTSNPSHSKIFVKFDQVWLDADS